MDVVVATWNETESATKWLVALIVLCSIDQYFRRKNARCKHCGGRMKKVHDTLLVERITDAITPRWQYERDRSPGVFKCDNCNRERKYL